MSLSHIRALNEMLLELLPESRAQAAQFDAGEAEQRRLLRALMNVCPPMPLSDDFLHLQDALLASEREERGTVDAAALPAAPHDPRITLWQGDITRLSIDAIVNAAIHSAAGLQLRNECDRIMRAQGHPEETGGAKITAGYNLPARRVIHTVGPIVDGALTDRHRELLASCYRSCLTLAAKSGCKSIAFCCISTGEFHFPNEAAAKIAVREVRDFLAMDTRIRRVVFNVFKDEDRVIYERLLS